MLTLTAYLFALSHVTRSPHQEKPLAPQPSPAEEIIWTGYGGNAQHTAESNYSPSGYGTILWSAWLDAAPPHDSTDILAHYGEASLTAKNIIIPVRFTTGLFEFECRNIDTGDPSWDYISTYTQLPSGWGWLPPIDGTLRPDGAYVGPVIGGGVFVRPHVDQASETIQTYYPCGVEHYTPAYSKYVFVSTPITSDAAGNIYYGIRTLGAVPDGMTSCFVKMTPNGTFTFYTCAGNHWPALNAAPALSNDGSTLYAVEASVNGSWESHIIALSVSNMHKIGDTLLLDPDTQNYALAISDGTASPLVGPDGDVYFGVYSNPWYDNNDKGWLLHFDGNLNPKGVPGAFGWDDTPSIVPSSIVPSYSGTSKYLLFCKYNNYADFSLQKGNNMVAVLDPNAQSKDPFSGLQVMNPVITVLGVTPDPAFTSEYPNAVHEWCINSAAVDIPGKSVVVNSEDGKIYKLDLTSGTLTDRIALTDGIGEPYTPTIIAKDGTIFAVSKARIYAVRARPIVKGGSPTAFRAPASRSSKLASLSKR